jgi:hypothetical protein
VAALARSRTISFLLVSTYCPYSSEALIRATIRIRWEGLGVACFVALCSNKSIRRSPAHGRVDSGRSRRCCRGIDKYPRPSALGISPAAAGARPPPPAYSAGAGVHTSHGHSALGQRCFQLLAAVPAPSDRPASVRRGTGYVTTPPATVGAWLTARAHRAREEDSPAAGHRARARLPPPGGRESAKAGACRCRCGRAVAPIPITVGSGAPPVYCKSEPRTLHGSTARCRK